MPQTYADPLQTRFEEIRKAGWHLYGLAPILTANATSGYNDPAARALSNLIGQEWPDQGLSSSYAYWAPTRKIARKLFGGTRDLSVSNSPSKGGDLAAHGSVLRLAAATRPVSVLQASGAQVHEVGGVHEVLIPAWDESASGYWVTEGQAVTPAGLSITDGVATPKTVGAVQTVSRRLLKQAIDIEDQLISELRRIVASSMEVGLWTGDGTNGTPIGIENTPGTETVTFASSTPTYAKLVEMVEAYLDQNGDPSAMLFYCNPKTLARLMTTEVSTGSGNFAASCIHGPRQLSLFGVPVAFSNAITDGTVILANPSDLHVVYWRSPQLIVNPFSSDTVGDVRLSVLNDVDVVVSRRHSLVIGRA
jgi:HK97 family phage major capsid protein